MVLEKNISRVKKILARNYLEKNNSYSEKKTIFHGL